MKKIKVRIKFVEEALGSSPADEEIYKKFIATKSPDASTLEDEVAAVGVDKALENAMTVYPKTAHGKEFVPFIWDYQIRGYFKEVCGIEKKIPGMESNGISAHKKLIDNYVFVTPRQIPLDLHGAKMGVCERALRAQTAQGERNALAASESVPEGTTAEFTVQLMIEKEPAKKDKPGVDYVKALTEWLDYGIYKGFGQWRNSGKGRFTYEIIES